MLPDMDLLSTPPAEKPPPGEGMDPGPERPEPGASVREAKAAEPAGGGEDPSEGSAMARPAGGEADPPAGGEGAPDGSESAPGGATGPEAGERTAAEVERELAVLLFASPDPLGESRLGELLQVPARLVREALEALGQRFAAAGLPYELRQIAGGWQIFTSPEMAETAALLARVRKEEKVSPAALETLAVVAYRQPVTKAEIEAIRGVQVGPILRALTERGLVKVAGRSDQPGHPLLYATTRKFLDSFGLAALDELPRDGELLRD